MQEPSLTPSYKRTDAVVTTFNTMDLKNAIGTGMTSLLETSSGALLSHSPLRLVTQLRQSDPPPGAVAPKRQRQHSSQWSMPSKARNQVSPPMPSNAHATTLRSIKLLERTRTILPRRPRAVSPRALPPLRGLRAWRPPQPLRCPPPSAMSRKSPQSQFYPMRRAQCLRTVLQSHAERG